jgi:hypothetical protein
MSNHDRYFKLTPPPQTPEVEICRCEGNRPIKLMASLSYNPLHCIDCNLEVAPESLALSVPLVEATAHWRDLYNAIDWLWLDSGEYEMWAKEQLVDIASPVNQRGIVLCRNLDAVRRCYYWYFQDQSVEGFKPITHCPNCHKPLATHSNGVFRQLICEQCTIITVGE